MTEEEAKTKWCPFIRWDGAHDVDGGCTWYSNRQGIDDANAVRCIASACMAWRWVKGPEYEDKYQDGHCGLAGKP